MRLPGTYISPADTGLYYLNSRYYDPQTGRFINADGIDTITASFTELTDKNLYAYCDNNPTTRKDDGGSFWDTVFDAVSLCFSVAEVIATPTNPMSWVSLAGDVIDLIPFVTGVGETAKVVGATLKITNAIDNTTDTIKIVKATELTKEAIEEVNKLDRIGKAVKSTRSAGTKIHKGYKTGYKHMKDMTKEAVQGSNRFDFLDEANKIIYELKTFNSRNLRGGIKQLQRYNDAMGGGYSMVLEFYGKFDF